MSEPTQLDRIEQMVTALVASWDAFEKAILDRASKQSAPSSVPPATSREPETLQEERNLGPVDLDSEHGNYVVKKNPPRWKGRDYAGKRLSETDPEFLDVLASFHEWRITKMESEGKDPKWAILDAVRASGWARRLRNGWTSKPQTEADDEIPF